MTILLRNRDYMFTVFEIDGEHYLTAVTGGVAQYDITLRLTKEEAASFADDENKAIATATDFVTRTHAYEARMVTPSIDPR